MRIKITTKERRKNMKIKSIELHNIGLYKTQTIDLYSPSTAVYMFWGNNGAGKTTLLNSIKTGLLGHKAFGSDYENYYAFVKDKLISSRVDENRAKAYIKICLEMKEQNTLVDYVIERTFDIIDDVLEETLEIYKEGNRLDFIAKERFLNKIETNLPPSLLEIIIFDGENAINILDRDEMHKLVKNIIYAVFGMDVYSNLIKDLNLYLKDMTINENNTSEDQINLISLESKYKECNLEVNTISYSLETYKRQRTVLLSNLNALLKKITSKTGVAFDEIVNIKNELANLQTNKKHLDEEIKYINEEILPLKILHKKIKNLLTELEAERPYMILNDLHSLMTFFEKDAESVEILKSLEKKITIGKEVKIKYNLSEDKLKIIQNIDKLLDSFTVEKLNTYYTTKSDAFSQLKAKIDSIEKLNDEESKEILSAIESLYSQLNEVQTNIDLLNISLEDKTSVLNEVKNRYEFLKKQMTALKKESNSYINIHLYKDAIESFLELNIKDICEKLSKMVLGEIRRIHFRNGSITKVYISPKNYEVHLYEESGKLIPSKLFSAGEKQILLGLVLKESISLSNIDTFFLFDTPVGRLDMNNRKIFTEEVIFKVSDQSIVFATDSDYSRKDYSLIKTKLTNEFKLSRNKSDQIVVTIGSIY